MDLLLSVLRCIHIGFGFIGLLAFWVTVLSRKGGVQHIRFGRWFERCAYVLLAAAALALGLRFIGLVQAGISPAERPLQVSFLVFLSYLVVISFSSVRFGVQVLRCRTAERLRQTHVGLLAIISVLASVSVILWAFWLRPQNFWLLLALSPIGLVLGSSIRRYLQGRDMSPRAWVIQHLEAMLGAGIAFHTAFAVFGINALVDLQLNGWLQLIPWVLPAAIGIPVISLWSAHYRRRYAGAVA